MNELNILKEIRRINDSFPYTTAIQEWKKQGKKVIGYLCTYIPEEIIYAAGILPIRITGDSRELELEEANAYLYIYTCSFVRSCLQLALKKQYDFLDGFVGCSTCDPVRRLADVWEKYLTIPFFHVLTIPRKSSPGAHRLYQHQVERFKQRLEEFSGQKISGNALRSAVEIYNKNRQLLSQLYELRKSDQPPLSGAEVLEVVNAGFRTNKEAHNLLLEKLLDEISTKSRKIKSGLRLMLSGSILNNPEFIETIESLGGVVVVDELCTGMRYFTDPVDHSATDYHLLEAISKRYLSHFPCARMVPLEDRFQRVINLIREYRVKGVITQIIRYCAPYAKDQILLKERLEHEGIPMLILDVEYGMGGIGPIRTRVQAFLEMLSKDI
jgi:benzoyl-CoA reductase subunit C